MERSFDKQLSTRPSLNGVHQCMGCISKWAESVNGDINVLACIIVLKISSLHVRKKLHLILFCKCILL